MSLFHPSEKETAQALLLHRGRPFNFSVRYLILMLPFIAFFIYLPFSLVELTTSNTLMYVGGMAIGFVVSNRFLMYFLGQMVHSLDPFIDWDKVEACASHGES